MAFTFSFSSLFKKKDRKNCPNYLILHSVNRQRNISEDNRIKYATELLDTYYGFGTPYLRSLINTYFQNKSTIDGMQKVAIALPLVNKFIRATSKVYSANPTRQFYLGGKQILPVKPDDITNPEKYTINEVLFNTLDNLYNKSVEITLKSAEEMTNLLDTTIYKVISKENGEIRLNFITNDNVQVCQDDSDVTIAKEIIFIKEEIDNVGHTIKAETGEAWNKDTKIIQNEDSLEEESDNNAGLEAEKLFDTKEIGWAFAPFVVFRNAQPTCNFWDLKMGDLFDYIKAINMSLTELRYLCKYTTFGLKYTVNMKTPKDTVQDPIGIINYAIDNGSGVPGGDEGKNWGIGEFENNGKIKELIESIIFNMKMIYDIRDINLDSLITTNSVRSADSKEMDNKNLFSYVNSQREIWGENEQNLFKVMCAVHNRDNTNKIPKGVEVKVNFEELSTAEKTNEDWMVEIQNNISTYIEWLGDKNPDLDTEELTRLFDNNISINSIKDDADDDDNNNDNNNKDKDGNNDDNL